MFSSLLKQNKSQNDILNDAFVHACLVEIAFRQYGGVTARMIKRGRERPIAHLMNAKDEHFKEQAASYLKELLADQIHFNNESLSSDEREALIGMLVKLYLSKAEKSCYVELHHSIVTLKKARSSAAFITVVEQAVNTINLDVALSIDAEIKNAMAMAIASFTNLISTDEVMINNFCSIMQPKLKKLMMGEEEIKNIPSLAGLLAWSKNLNSFFDISDYDNRSSVSLAGYFSLTVGDRLAYEYPIESRQFMLALALASVFAKEFELINIDIALRDKFLLAIRTNKNSFFSLLPNELINKVGYFIDSKVFLTHQHNAGTINKTAKSNKQSSL